MGCRPLIQNCRMRPVPHRNPDCHTRELTIIVRATKVRCTMNGFASVVGAVLLVFGAWASAQNQLSTKSLEGLWLTDEYGALIEFQGDDLRSSEITTLSCIPALKATHKNGVGTPNEIIFTSGDDTFRVSPGTSQDTRWLHIDGSVSSILLRRSASRPEVCRQTLADTPLTNYQVFWESFAEHYPFFALRQTDWLAVDKKFRPEVTPAIKPEELFRIFHDMIEPLHDAHTGIAAKSIQQRFHGYRPAADPCRRKMRLTSPKS